MAIHNPLTLTPYSAQTLFKEITNIREGEISLENFILKTDLLNLKDKLQLEIEQQIIVEIVLDLLIRIEKMEMEAPEIFQGYLNGLSYLNKCDLFLRNRKLPTSKQIIKASGLAHLQTLVYLDLKIRGRDKDLGRIDWVKMKEEIENEYKLKGSTSREGGLIEGLNQKLVHIVEVLNTTTPAPKEEKEEAKAQFLLSQIDTLLETTRHTEEKVSQKALFTKEVLEEAKSKLLETDRLTRNVSEIADLVEGSANSLGGVKTQIIDNLHLVGETKDRLYNMDKGIKILEETLIDLNNLIRQDILLGMSKVEKNVENVSLEIENLGKKYREWRKI